MGDIEKKLQCIVIAEDNDDDYFQILRTLEESNPGVALTRVATITELFNFFDRAGRGSQKDCYPDLLILDPNLADGNALEKLPQLKSGSLREFSTIVLSGIGEVPQIKAAYKAGADTFMPKPLRGVELTSFLTFRGFHG